MTVIIHGRATSSNVQAVMWGAAELGLPVERRDIGGRFGGLDTPEYRAINPVGLIPALEDGAVRMFESAAILRYLDTAYGGGRLAGEDPAGASWAEWAKHTLCEAFTVPVFWAYWRTPEPDRDMAKVMAALRRFEGHLALAMRKRGDAPWIMGEALTLADIFAGHVLYRYFTLDFERDVPEGLADYYAALTGRAAFRAHVMIDYSDLKGTLRT